MKINIILLGLALGMGSICLAQNSPSDSASSRDNGAAPTAYVNDVMGSDSNGGNNSDDDSGENGENVNTSTPQTY